MNRTMLLLALLAPAALQAAHAGGAGGEESGVQQIGDSYYRVVLGADPGVLEGGEDRISLTLSLVDEDTGRAAPGVEYRVRIYDGGPDPVVEFEALAPGERLHATIVPGPDTGISGDRADGGAWLATEGSPLEIGAPLFLAGGLVDFEIDVLSVDSVPGGAGFEIRFTMGEFVPFTVDIAGEPTGLVFATYFEAVDRFEYEGGRLAAHMPFDWDRGFIESIPFVHAEYYIPKTVDVFDDHDIILDVNGLPYFGTVDRSGDGEIVVHFLLSSSRLLKMLDEVPADMRDTMVFGIEPGRERDVQEADASLEDGDKVIVLSSEEDWKFHMSLSPAGRIHPGEEVRLELGFHDPVTNSVIPQITYDIDVFLDGIIVESHGDRGAPDGRDSVRVVFADEGAAIVRISDVNGYDTSGQFSFRVAGPGAAPAGDHAVGIPPGTSLPGCELEGACYEPELLEVSPGESVLWSNADSAAHTVTSGAPGDPSNMFDSGVVAAGGAFAFTFADPGTFPYHCSLHPWMTGTVAVGAQVPAWVKDSAGWWADGLLSDGEFAAGLGYLVREGLIDVPGAAPGGGSGGPIPEWVRSSASWWAGGQLPDGEFLRGVEWMMQNGVIPA